MVAKVMVLVVLGCVGCGDSPRSPAEKCDDLVSLTCDRAVECISWASGMHDECVQAIRQELACGTVKSVGPSYDRCMDQLDDQSCPILFPRDQDGDQALILPADCNGVLLMEAARGEVDPAALVSTPLAGAIRGVTGAGAR
jgi:hypothetical protein